MVKDFIKLSKKVLLAQITLYILLFSSFNNKTFFPPIILFAFYLFWLLEDLHQALWLTLIAVFPFSWWGLRFFKTDFFYFSITAKFLISIFLFLSLALFKQNKITIKKKDYFIFAFLIFALISFLRSKYFSLGFLGFWEVFQTVLFYFLARFFTRDKKIKQLTFNSLFLLAGFEGLWASTQFLLQRPLGRILEPEKDIHPFGIIAFEDIFQFRSSGTLAHPNTLLVFLSLIFPLILSQVIAKKPLVKNKILTYSTLVFSMLGIIFTMSRYGWLIIFLTTFIVICYFWRKKQIQPFFLTRKFFTLFLLLFLLLLPVVSRRAVTFRSAFKGKYNSWRSRKELIEEALFMIKTNSIFGIGPNHFLIALRKNNLTKVADYFFYPVHNLYLLLASELGLPALFCWAIFVYLNIKEKILNLKKKSKTNFWGISIAQLASIFCFLFLVLIYTGIGINLTLFFIFLGINFS